MMQIRYWEVSNHLDHRTALLFSNSRILKITQLLLMLNQASCLHQDYKMSTTMLALCLSLLSTTWANYQTSSCLYIQHLSLQDAGGNMVANTPYSFPITWTSEQTDLATGGLISGGYHIVNTNSIPSFTAVLNDVTTTGATVVFTNLDTNAEVVQVQFDVVFGRTGCQSYLQVITTTQTPTILSDGTGALQTFFVDYTNIPAASTGVKLEGYVQSYISTITDLSDSNSRIDYGFASASFNTYDNGTGSFAVQSFTSSNCRYSQIVLVWIFYLESGFTNPTYFGQSSVSLTGNDTATDLTITLTGVSSTVPSNQCLSGLSFQLGDTNTISHPLKKILRSLGSSNTLSAVKTNFLVSRQIVVCFVECLAGTQKDPDQSDFTCFTCSTALPDCLTCTSTTVCAEYCNTTVAGCVTCGGSNNCTTCSTGVAYSPTMCECSSDSKCVTCTDRLTCGTCLVGFYPSTSGSTTTCQACSINNCLDCTSATTCETCKGGFTVESGACVASSSLSGSSSGSSSSSDDTVSRSDFNMTVGLLAAAMVLGIVIVIVYIKCAGASGANKVSHSPSMSQERIQRKGSSRVDISDMVNDSRY